MPFFTDNILYYVERGVFFSGFCHSTAVESRERKLSNARLHIQSLGVGAWRDDGCPRRLSGRVVFKCLLSVGFSKKDLDRAKFVYNWLRRLFLLIAVVVISK